MEIIQLRVTHFCFQVQQVQQEEEEEEEHVGMTVWQDLRGQAHRVVAWAIKRT